LEKPARMAIFEYVKLTTVISVLFLLQLSVSAQQQPSSTLQEPNVRMVKLYPNPAVSYITFDLRGNYKQGLTLQVYSGILGKKIFSTVFTQERYLLNLNDFPRGIYIYHLTDSNGKIIESGKFQVTK
jgi:hypothetical protein